MPSSCASQEVINAAGGAANGVSFATGLVPYTHTDDPDVATYLAKLRVSSLYQRTEAQAKSLLKRVPGLPGRALSRADAGKWSMPRW